MDAFQASKKLLISAPVLVHFDHTHGISLACDASPYRVSAVLSHQMPDGTEKPIAFASQSLSEAEKKYPQIVKEGLACVFGVKKFHTYLYGHTFSLITTSYSSPYLIKKNNPSTSLWENSTMCFNSVCL